jgi:alpha-D-ribose 1-methylphosphonate 5-triphosphate synthase subunit PhnG
MNAPGQDPAPGAAAGPGLSWCFETDFEALQQALDTPPPWARPAATPARDASTPPGSGAPQQPAADPDHGGRLPGPGTGDQLPGADGRDEFPDPVEGGEMPLAVVAGRVAEALAPGPDLAAWLALAACGQPEPGAKPGIAASWRRLAAWAQAGELACVAQMAADGAAADPDTGVLADGRPARVTLSVAGEVALALSMSQYGATEWTHLAVTLGWRLAATGQALASGQIDLTRARLIAEATSVLGDDKAKAVEAKVLPAAGQQTRAQLLAALRLAVIAADPDGAERRRQEAERRARVGFYPDAEGTATLAGHNLSGVHAAAAMARINALAKARKAAGATGGIGLLRAETMLGLLLGTLPYIPPAPGDPGTPSPGGDPGSGNGDADPDSPPPSGPATPPGRNGGSDGGDNRARPGGSDGGEGGAARPGRGAGQQASGSLDGAPGPDDPGVPPAPDGPDLGPWQGQPDPADQDAPTEDGLPPGEGAPPEHHLTGDDLDDEFDGTQPCPWAGMILPAPAWPPLPAPGQTGPIPPGLRPPGWPQTGPDAGLSAGPGGGGLDLTVPWPVLAGQANRPALLARFGPVTAAQARQAAAAAAADPATQWRVILTDTDGHALAVTRIPGPRPSPGTCGSPARGSPDAADRQQRAGPVGRVTITITTRTLSRPPPHDHSACHGILTRALNAARRAARRAAAATAADRAAGGCAHTAASDGYRPAPRLRDYITARDLTCRMPICRQPAWRGDLDHTIPYHRGGATCTCNLGGRCRTHHILKSLPGWQLRQTRHGTFVWTTPSGRTYQTTPDPYPT